MIKPDGVDEGSVAGDHATEKLNVVIQLKLRADGIINKRNNNHSQTK